MRTVVDVEFRVFTAEAECLAALCGAATVGCEYGHGAPGRSAAEFVHYVRGMLCGHRDVSGFVADDAATHDDSMRPVGRDAIHRSCKLAPLFGLLFADGGAVERDDRPRRRDEVRRARKRRRCERGGVACCLHAACDLRAWWG